LIDEPKRFSGRHWWNYVTVLLLVLGLTLWGAELLDGRIVFGTLLVWVLAGFGIAREIIYEHLGFADRWIFHDYTKAHQRYRKAVDTNRATPQAYCALASLAYAEGDLIESARLLDEAAQRLPRDPYLHFLLSGVLARQGRYDEAVHEADVTGSLSGDGVLGDMALGTTLTAKGDMRAAASAYQRAVEKAPRLVAARLGLAQCYLSLGMLEAARGETEEALRLDPKNSDALYWAGRVAHAEQRHDEADRLLQTSLDGRPVQDKAHLVPYRDIVTSLSEARSELMSHLDRM
jgi:tetratricopeptide (TPR) repeat protein